MAFPSGMNSAMGTQCKSNTGTPANTYICAASSSYSPTSTMYIAGNDPLSNLHSWDTTNKYFWVNFGQSTAANGINWFYDLNLDMTYTSYCNLGNHFSGCTSYSV